MSLNKEKGWSVKWEDKRKHIVFENENGDKVRDSKIEKTFSGLRVNKEDDAKIVIGCEFKTSEIVSITKLNLRKIKCFAEVW